MKALIIGAAGFVGSYLIKHLKSTYDWELHVTKLPNEALDADGVQIHDLDILKPAEVRDILEAVKPDYIFIWLLKVQLPFPGRIRH